MAKATVSYPLGEMLHRTDRLPRRHCRESGSPHQGQDERGEVWKQRVETVRGERVGVEDEMEDCAPDTIVHP
jgi:hypothetical protein